MTLTAIKANLEDSSTAIAEDDLQHFSGRRFIPKAALVDDLLDQVPANKLRDEDTRYNARLAEIIVFPEYKLIESSPSEYMWAVQEWDGHVTDIESDQFIALLAPISDDGEESERLEYPLNALSSNDRSNLRVGSIFRLSCGYTRKRSGTIMQQMVLYFRSRKNSAESESESAAIDIADMFRRAVVVSSTSLSKETATS